MKYHYSQFSIPLALPNEDAVGIAHEAINLLLLNDVDWALADDQITTASISDVVPDIWEGEKTTRAAQELALKLYRLLRASAPDAVAAAGIYKVPTTLNIGVAVNKYEGDENLYFSSEDEEGADHLTTVVLVQGLIKEFDLGTVAFDYAFTHRDAYGGGAACCTADGVEYMSTEDWVIEKMAADNIAPDAGPSAPAP